MLSAPIIHQRQAALLGVEAIRKAPAGGGGELPTSEFQLPARCRVGAKGTTEWRIAQRDRFSSPESQGASGPTCRQGGLCRKMCGGRGTASCWG
ncbi:MAG: hypothetical protein L0214_09565 [candidate division NC10 bacterium]|nr:hypothetical protein [candidate division NC10 bacterium]